MRIVAGQYFLSAVHIMPVDAAVLKGVPAALSATDLLMAVAVKLPCSGQKTLRRGSSKLSLSSDSRELL